MADFLQKQLTELHEYGLEVVDGIPDNQRVWITSHDAFRELTDQLSAANPHSNVAEARLVCLPPLPLAGAHESLPLYHVSLGFSLVFCLVLAVFWPEPWPLAASRAIRDLSPTAPLCWPASSPPC